MMLKTRVGSSNGLKEKTTTGRGKLGRGKRGKTDKKQK